MDKRHKYDSMRPFDESIPGDLKPKEEFFAVSPSPATHAILTVLEAGESVFQTLLLTKTVFHALRGRGTAIVSCTFWRQNTGALLGPAFHEKG